VPLRGLTLRVLEDTRTTTHRTKGPLRLAGAIPPKQWSVIEVKMELISWLENWYRSQCKFDWEQLKGIKIETLENPGWLIQIDLADTHLERFANDRVLVAEGTPPSAANGNAGGPEWMECKFEAGQFVGAGDPARLGQILKVFQHWVIEQEERLLE
jgi:Immunity protein 53